MNFKNKTVDFAVLNIAAVIAYLIPVVFMRLFISGFSPIWPSAGIAAFFAIVYGKKTAMGIFIGSILANIMLKWSPFAIILVSAGNTAGPFISAYFLKLKKFQWKGFDAIPQFIAFLIFIVLMNSFLTAAVGSIAYSFNYYFSSGDGTPFIFSEMFYNFFLADAAGIISLTPVIYLWNQNYGIKINKAYFKNFTALTLVYILTIFVLYLSFAGLTETYRGIAILCIILPIFIVALKYDQREALTLNFLVLYSFFYILLVKTQNLSFAHRIDFLSGLQVSGIIISSVAIIFTSLVKERNLAVEKLKNSHSGLESELSRKTERLKESEETFRIMADRSPVGIFIYQEKFRYANKFALEKFGYSAEEFYGFAPQDIIGDEDEKEFVTQKTKEKINGKAFDGQYVFNIKTRTGAKFIFNFYTTTIMYNGKTAGLAVFIDDTERKELADRLKESESFFRTMSENMESGLVLYGEKIIYANPAALKITEYDADKLKEKFVWELFDGGHAQTIKTNLKRRLKGELYTSVFTMKLITPSGRVKTVLLKNSTVNYKGSWCGIATFIDISEIEDMKSAFVSLVSHEIRTPLASIAGFAKLIDKKIQNALKPLIESEIDINSDAASGGTGKFKKIYESIDSYLEIIFSESKRLGNLVNDVLDVSKIESGRMEWKSEVFKIEDAVNKSVNSMRSLLNNEKIDLKVDIGAELPEINADEERIVQVIINLLSNAVKFTENGAITIKASKEDLNIKVSVSDTGIGIPLDDLDSIFDKFKQVSHRQLTDKPKGTGLGLYICRQIVEYYGGKIWAESEPGRGSMFSFILPGVYYRADRPAE